MHSTQLPLSIALPFAIVLSIAGPRAIGAQQASSIPRALTLEQAREIARTVAPELTAAREALAAARARERQATAVPNPLLVYGREQTSGSGATNAQNIASIEQRIRDWRTTRRPARGCSAAARGG